jgi:urease accessory protein
MCNGAAITLPGPLPTLLETADQPRARGQVRLSVKLRDGRTVLDRLHQSGSMKALFPRATHAPFQAVLINTAGGITGGDSFATAIHAAPGTDLSLTTQAAERAYRAQPGTFGRLQTRLTVDDTARLAWIPQETILFQGCALDRSLAVDMHGSASLLLAEPVIFGRMAMRETLTRAQFHDRIDLRRDGRRLFLDATRMSGDIAAQLARPGVADGARALVTLLYVADDAETHLDPLRALLPPTGGASLLARDVLVLRALAADGFELRRALVPALTRLTKGNLPRCWMI